MDSGHLHAPVIGTGAKTHRGYLILQPYDELKCKCVLRNQLLDLKVISQSASEKTMYCQGTGSPAMEQLLITCDDVVLYISQVQLLEQGIPRSGGTAPLILNRSIR